MGLLETIWTLNLFKRSVDHLSDGADKNIQIIKNKVSGPRVNGT